MLALLLFPSVVSAYSPYNLADGWTYYIEAVRTQNWPDCAYRFLSYPSTCDKIDMWNAAGGNEQFTLEAVSADTFYLKTSCGRYLSYPSDCSSATVDTWAEAGINQQFRIYQADSPQFQFYLQAVGRSTCDKKYLSFPAPCTTGGPDLVDLWSGAGVDQRFRFHPVASSTRHNHAINSDAGCADPFSWRGSDGNYHLVCTDGNLGLSISDSITNTAVFKQQGSALGGNPPPWAQNANRWAPENIEMNGVNTLFVASPDSAGIHRVGWVQSGSSNPNSWTRYSPSALNLGQTAGGEIDAHVFRDPSNNSTFLLWKSDDNNAGWTYTRIWAQQVSISAGAVIQQGAPQVIMDSTGLWWASSWTPGGSLIEGPEMVKVGDWYYLFFAAGRYCQDDYYEGAARSKSIFGPFEKMPVPLLSTGMTGYANGAKIVGPGHGTFVQVKDQLWVIYHASAGENCNRMPFIDSLIFGGSDGWPVVDFAA